MFEKIFIKIFVWNYIDVKLLSQIIRLSEQNRWPVYLVYVNHQKKNEEIPIHARAA